MKKFRKQAGIYLIIVASVFAYLFVNDASVFPEWERGKLYMYSLDVGQADSTFIVLPDGETLLIDAGNREDTAFVTRFIENTGIEKLDYVIATHPHEDHIGGIAGVINEFEIGEFYMPDATNITVYYEDMLDGIIEKDIKAEFPLSGTVIKDGECKIEVLSPFNKNYEDINHFSIVTKITYRDTSFILMGDAEKVNEYDMLDAYGKYLESDVIKIGHHGSSTSNTKKFLKTVNPYMAVISVGADNEYGHPHKEIKSRLRDLKIPYYRTDFAGTVLFMSDGEKIEVITEKEADNR